MSRLPNFSSWIPGVSSAAKVDSSETSAAMSDESICSDYEVIDKKDSSAWEELLATVRRIDQKTETQAINEQEQVQRQSPKDGTWQLEHYRTSARENRQYAESLNAQLYHAKQMIEHWEERGEMYEAHIDDLIEEVKDRQKELESTRAHIQFLQQREMMNYTRPGWRAEEDARVRHVLYELHWNIHSWAERYAVHSLEFFRDNVRNRGFFRNTVLHDLQDVAKIDLRTFRELPRPFLLVVGMLSKHLFTHIFKHPFFLLSESLQKTEQKPSCGRCLDDVYHELLKGNKADAHLFRTHLLRTIFLGPLHFSQSAQKFCERITDEFWWNKTVVLLGNGAAQVSMLRDELTRIVTKAASLRNYLSTHSISYEWQLESRHLDMLYYVRSPLATAHWCNGLDSSGEDQRCDGMPIRIVCSPLVMAIGDSIGGNYDYRRIICPAGVWVDDREDGVDEEMM
ncbi:hypothetical protein HDK64DRAFT_299202 [Phyllosticta capitalensis]